MIMAKKCDYWTDKEIIERGDAGRLVTKDGYAKYLKLKKKQRKNKLIKILDI